MSVPMWRPVDIGDTGGAEEHAGYTCGRWTRVACRRRRRRRRTGVAQAKVQLVFFIDKRWCAGYVVQVRA